MLVSLPAIEAIHVDWRGGTPMPGINIGAEKVRKMKLKPKSITAFLVGLKSRVAVFQLQRQVNIYRAEPLSAVMPGVALHALWDLMSMAENVLLAVSGAVVLVGLSGMLTAILANLNERRREMAILRSIGARPWQISLLLAGEASILSVSGVLAGLGLLYGAMALLRPWAETHYGLVLGLGAPSVHEWTLMVVVILAGLVVGLIPAWRAYRLSLSDGMSVRI